MNRIPCTPCRNTSALAVAVRPLLGCAVALSVGEAVVRLSTADARRLAQQLDPPPCPLCGGALALTDCGELYCLDCPLPLALAATLAAA